MVGKGYHKNTTPLVVVLLELYFKELVAILFLTIFLLDVYQLTLKQQAIGSDGKTDP